MNDPGQQVKGRPLSLDLFCNLWVSLSFERMVLVFNGYVLAIPNVCTPQGSDCILLAILPVPVAVGGGVLLAASATIHLFHKSVSSLIWSLLMSQGDSESVPYHSGYPAGPGTQLRDPRGLNQ